MLKKIILIQIFMLYSLNLYSQFNNPVATIKLTKTEVISIAELDEKANLVSQQSGQPLNRDLKKQTLELIILDKLVLQAAERDKVSVSDGDAIDYAKRTLGGQATSMSNEQFITLAAQQSGQSRDAILKTIKESFTKQKYTQEYVMKNGQAEMSQIKKPTDAEVNEFFEQERSNFVRPESVGISHIFFRPKSEGRSGAKSLALDTLNKIKSGSLTFEQAVTQFSDDPQSKSNKGILGYLSRNDPQARQIFGSDFVNELFKLQLKNPSNPIESNQGFHIILVTEKLEAKLLNLTDQPNPLQKSTVKELIEMQLMQSSQNRIVQKHTQALYDRIKSQSEINIFEERIK